MMVVGGCTMTASFQLGRYQAQVVSAGTFALDGGAMFGIIPKPLWEKKMAADEANRIDLGTNCLLLRDGVKTVLVDCGMGTKWQGKQQQQFKVHTHLSEQLIAAGSSMAEVTDLVLTHLHFDHAGGTTLLDADGSLQMAFANARVHVAKRNWLWAAAPNERDRGSYRNDSWLPLTTTDNDRLVLHDDVNGAVTLFDELTAVLCDGHTTGQMLPLVGALDQRALYSGDMIPTRAHVRMPWIMGYDLRPVTMLEEKRRLLSLCADERVRLVYEHDPVDAVSMIHRDGDDFSPQSMPPSIHGGAS
jgi:glyoxylase-like metal-dependent hydrolase (beta-lactamase superfamily II)